MDILDPGVTLVTSVTFLPIFPNLPLTRLHRGESHPQGRGWIGPGGLRSSQDVNTEGTGHQSEMGTHGAHLMTPEVVKDTVDHRWGNC